MAVVPRPCTDLVGKSASFTRDAAGSVFRSIQLIRAGIDLMNTAYNYLDLTPNGGDEGGRTILGLGPQRVRGFRIAGAIRNLFRAGVGL